jgi:hypothetical protein
LEYDKFAINDKLRYDKEVAAWVEKNGPLPADFQLDADDDEEEEGGGGGEKLAPTPAMQEGIRFSKPQPRGRFN